MKRILLVIISGLMAFSLVACGGEKPQNKEPNQNQTEATEKSENKGEKITLYGEIVEGDDVRYAVDFYYPGDVGIILEGDEDNPSWIDMNYESKNITVSPSVFEDTTFDANKEYSKENEETYKEFDINGYDCYGYESFGGYWIYVHFEELSETTDRYMVISTEINDYSIDDTPEGIAHYEDEDLKKIIESFEVRGVVDYPEEE